MDGIEPGAARAVGFRSMRERWINWLDGIGSVLDIFPVHDSRSRAFESAIRHHLTDRPSDYEAVLYDMRTAMITSFDRLPVDERSRLESVLRPDGSSGYERRIADARRNSAGSAGNGQLEFGFGVD